MPIAKSMNPAIMMIIHVRVSFFIAGVGSPRKNVALADMRFRLDQSVDRYPL